MNERDPKPPAAYQLKSGDVAGFGWDFADGFVLYFQPPSLRGSVLQVAMTRQQFQRMMACGREMEKSVEAHDATRPKDLAANPTSPAPAMAGEES